MGLDGYLSSDDSPSPLPLPETTLNAIHQQESADSYSSTLDRSSLSQADVSDTVSVPVSSSSSRVRSDTFEFPELLGHQRRKKLHGMKKNSRVQTCGVSIPESRARS